MSFAGALPLHAQLKSEVTVDTSRQKAVLYTTSIGIAADRWESNAYDSTTLQLLQDAGFTNLRFPGNNGIDALYHWSNGTITNPYTDDRAPAFPKEKHFPAVVPVIDKLGTAIVSVNYGTNLDGSGGGEPDEAAAWVAGTRYDYGKLTIDAGKTITEGLIEGLGGTFSVEVPRYGVTEVVIPKAP
jgi:hypothetical protein